MVNKSYPDGRRFDTGDQINVFKKNGVGVKGKVVSVSYGYVSPQPISPNDQEQGFITHEEILDMKVDHAPAQRGSFTYVVEVGTRKIGTQPVFEYDAKPNTNNVVGQEDVFESITETINDADFKD